MEAQCFADCSGDSILAPLTGAEFRWGRESRGEYGEDIAPPVADRKTMGMSCLMQLRETSNPQTFIPPPWAYVFRTDEELQNRYHGARGNNFWWIEVGGEGDSIHDTPACKRTKPRFSLLQGGRLGRQFGHQPQGVAGVDLLLHVRGQHQVLD